MKEIQTPTHTMREVVAALDAGRAVPYLGPEMLSLVSENCPLPRSLSEYAR
jgi:hypothetical protein